MSDNSKNLGDCPEELGKSSQKLQREYWSGIAEELGDRLSRIRKEAIAEGEMKKAEKLSVCEAMATVIKRFFEGEENENEKSND